MPSHSTEIGVFVMPDCGAAAPGATFYALANMTQGLTASTCQSDCSSIFDKLRGNVVETAPLPSTIRSRYLSKARRAQGATA